MPRKQRKSKQTAMTAMTKNSWVWMVQLHDYNLWNPNVDGDVVAPCGGAAEYGWNHNGKWKMMEPQIVDGINKAILNRERCFWYQWTDWTSDGNGNESLYEEEYQIDLKMMVQFCENTKELWKIMRVWVGDSPFQR
jgi:hypothetical protein